MCVTLERVKPGNDKIYYGLECIWIGYCEVLSNSCVDQYIVEDHVLLWSKRFQHHVDLFLLYLASGRPLNFGCPVQRRAYLRCFINVRANYIMYYLWLGINIFNFAIEQK
jgi:hypothetical protein